MRTYAISCRPCLLALGLICALRRRFRRRNGGGDDDDDDNNNESTDMTTGGSDSSGGRGSDRSSGGSDGEGRNKGVFCERRGGERDEEERLVVSKGGGTGLYHTIRMHTRTRKGGRHEKINTPVEMSLAGADREDHGRTRQDDPRLPRQRLNATWMRRYVPLRIHSLQDARLIPSHLRGPTGQAGQDALGRRPVTWPAMMMMKMEAAVAEILAPQLVPMQVVEQMARERRTQVEQGR